jgi:hypothetical protein
MWRAPVNTVSVPVTAAIWVHLGQPEKRSGTDLRLIHQSQQNFQPSAAGILFCFRGFKTLRQIKIHHL